MLHIRACITNAYLCLKRSICCTEMFNFSWIMVQLEPVLSMGKLNCDLPSYLEKVFAPQTFKKVSKKILGN